MTGHEAVEGWEGILAPGEELLWQGQPESGFDFWGESPLDIAFGMTLTGGPLAPIGLLAPILGAKVLIFVPVLVIGLWMLVGKAAWRSYRLRRTWYSLTTARVFVATARLGRQRLHEFPLTPATEVTETDGAGGGLLLSAPEGYGLLLERLPDRQEILTLIRRVQSGARCTALSTTSG